MTGVYLEYVHTRPEWTELLYQLSQAAHFTAADVAANRRMRIGQYQRWHQLQTALGPPLLMLATGLVISAIVRIAFASYVDQQPILPYVRKIVAHLLEFDLNGFREAYLLTSGNRLPLLVGAFVVSAPTIAYPRIRQIPFRMVADLLLGRVRMAEGLVAASTEEKKAPGRAGRKGETIDCHYFHVGGEKLSVSPATSKVYAAGVKYRVYYLPWSKEVMSIEPVIPPGATL